MSQSGDAQRRPGRYPANARGRLGIRKLGKSRWAIGLRLHPPGAGGRIRSDVEQPEVRYARTVDGVNIAYQVRGDGPVDLVYTLGMAGNFEIEFEAPWGTRFLERLATFSRVILFDKRGTGLSDRVLGAPDFDMRGGRPACRPGRSRVRTRSARREPRRGEPRRVFRRDAPQPGLCSRPLQLMGTDSVGTGLPCRHIDR